MTHCRYFVNCATVYRALVFGSDSRRIGPAWMESFCHGASKQTASSKKLTARFFSAPKLKRLVREQFLRDWMPRRFKTSECAPRAWLNTALCTRNIVLKSMEAFGLPRFI